MTVYVCRVCGAKDTEPHKSGCIYIGKLVNLDVELNDYVCGFCGARGSEPHKDFCRFASPKDAKSATITTRSDSKMSSLYCVKCGAKDGERHHDTCLFAGTVFTANKSRVVDNYQIGGDHYKELAVQPWAAMESWMSEAEFEGFLRGNAIKYLSRAGRKGDGLQDLKKALHYLEKLVSMKEQRE